MMKKYYVKVPITGYLELEVEAYNDAEAISSAIQLGDLSDLMEWKSHREVCQGNVFMGLANEVDILYVEDIDEE